MSVIYDVFADEYIDEKDMDPMAPPERYRDVDSDMLVNNAARWFLEAFFEVETGGAWKYKRLWHDRNVSNGRGTDEGDKEVEDGGGA